MDQGFRATQFVGSQAEAEVLLEQPRAEIVIKQYRRRGRRQDNEYLIRYEGYPDSDNTWYTEQRLRRLPNGPQLIAEYEAAIQEQEAAFEGPANSSDEDMTSSVDIQGNPGEQRAAVVDQVVNQMWTQQPSELQLPQTQPPSQVTEAPVLARTAPATQEPDPTWEDHRSRSKQIEAAYRRELQAGPGRPSVLRPPQHSGVLNGLPTNLWENSPLVTRSAHAQRRSTLAAPPQHRAPVQQHGSYLQPRPVQLAQAGPSNAADALGFDDADEPSQEDLAAADWAAQHAALQRPANPLVSARQNQPVGPEQIGYLAADPFGRHSPAAAVQPTWAPHQQSRPAAEFGGPAPRAEQQPRHIPSSFRTRDQSHWLGPSREAYAQPLWAAAPRQAAGPMPSHDYHQHPQPATWASHVPSPGSSEPPQRQNYAAQDVPALGPLSARSSPVGASHMARASAAEPARQPLGPLPVGAQQVQAAAPSSLPGQGVRGPETVSGQAAWPAASGSHQMQEAAHTGWFNSIAMQLLPGRGRVSPAVPARAAEPQARLHRAAAAEPQAPAAAGEGAEGLPPPRQWPAQRHASPPQRLQSPVRPVAAAAPEGAPAEMPAAEHQGPFNALGRRAAEMIRQAPPAPEGTEGVPAGGCPQMEHVHRERWQAWASSLQELGGTVAAYAAAQVLPPEVAARSGAQSAPLMDLNHPPAARAQPEEAEEPIEDFIDVPSMPAGAGADEGREAREPQGGRRRFKRLKRIYQADPGEEGPERAPDPAELVPDSSEETGAQEPAHKRRNQGGAWIAPMPARRQSHVLEDDEEATEEDMDVVGGAGSDLQLNEETPEQDIVEADAVSNEYGLTPEELRHLQPDQWEGAVINRARHEDDDVLLLRIHWPDDFSAWVNRYALHVRPHCHMKLIDFYESKAKPRK